MSGSGSKQDGRMKPPRKRATVDDVEQPEGNRQVVVVGEHIVSRGDCLEGLGIGLESVHRRKCSYPKLYKTRRNQIVGICTTGVG